MANDIKSAEECLKAVSILFEELRNAKRSLISSEGCIVNRGLMQAQLEYLRDNLPDTVKKERLHTLSALQDKIRAELLADFVKTNGDVDVLFENTVDGYAIGHAPNFMEVKVKTECNLSGKIVNIKLTHSDDSYLYGEI